MSKPFQTESTLEESSIRPQTILYFDGVCNLCHGLVQFVLENSPNKDIFFASLQSEEGLNILKETNQNTLQMDSVVLAYQGELLQKSDAILALFSAMGGFWRWTVVLRIFPRWIRDLVYDYVAKKRYAWFGKKDQCMLPTPETADRFIS